jgi:uncharacterized protein YndB with AHSA1/START domain
MKNTITIQIIANAPIEKVWEYWTSPEHITGWAFATPEWEARDPENDLRVGGKFKTTMAAKDGSQSFDFTGVYTEVRDPSTGSGQGLIDFTMDDQRKVKVQFSLTPEGVEVIESFEPESENSLEMQQQGWQAILDNFKKYVESKK